MTTTADRRAAELLQAQALTLEGEAAMIKARAFTLLGEHIKARRERSAASSFFSCAASKRQDAEQVPHNSEVE